MAFVVTNCVIVKKYANIAFNDLVPTWLSQRYMFVVTPEKNTQNIEVHFKNIAQSVPTAETKFKYRVSNAPKVIHRAKYNTNGAPKVKHKFNNIGSSVTKTIHSYKNISQNEYIDGFDILFGAGHLK